MSVTGSRPAVSLVITNYLPSNNRDLPCQILERTDKVLLLHGVYKRVDRSQQETQKLSI
jgi:hypothetical protein